MVCKMGFHCNLDIKGRMFFFSAAEIWGYSTYVSLRAKRRICTSVSDFTAAPNISQENNYSSPTRRKEIDK